MNNLGPALQFDVAFISLFLSRALLHQAFITTTVKSLTDGFNTSVMDEVAQCVKALKFNVITSIGVNERSDEKVENCDEENDK